MSYDSRFTRRPMGLGIAALALATIPAAVAAPQLRSVRLLAPNTGWLLAGNHLLWTSSAGFQWTDITPAPEGRTLYGVFFLDASHGWLLRSASAETPELARTSDGGAHWSISAFPLSAQDSAGFGRAATLNFTDAEHGSAMLRLTTSSNFGFGLPFTTADGGVTWTRASSALRVANHSGPEILGNGQGWVLTSEGHCIGFKTGCTLQQKLLATSDSGRSFHDITPALASPESTEIGMGQGFDQCSIGSTGAMQTWYSSSPYRYANAYIGGINRACSQPGLSSSWVNTVVAQGWRLFPTWVGPQAPCVTSCPGCSHFSNNSSTAATQGTNNANTAASVAAKLGLTNTIIYYDMEVYSSGSCAAAVQAFVNSWTAQLHAKGNLAGVYGSPYNASDWASISNPPDDVWIADWNDQDTVWNLSPLSNGLWVNNQRLHQYVGGHNETWGGVTFNIDTDVLDGSVTP